MISIPILTFHSVDVSGSVISIGPAQLQTFLEFLDRNDFKTLTLLEAAARLRAPEANEKGRTVVLTFDDGFENFYTEAFPRLQALNMTATVFVVPNRCGHTNDWAQRGLPIPVLPLLTWARIDELNRHGIEIGSHSCSHPDLTEISEEKARFEIAVSGKLIEDCTGVVTHSFSYPFGLSDEYSQARVREHYRCAVGTRLATAHSGENQHNFSRIDTYYLKSNPMGLLHPWREPYLWGRRAGRGVRGLFYSGSF